MSAPVKFLAVAVAGWITFRAAASALALPEAAPATPPLPGAPPAQAVAGPPMSYAPLGPGPVQAPQQYPAAPYGYAPAAYPYPYPPGPYGAPYGYPPPPPPGWGAPAPRPTAMPMPVYYPVPVAAAAMPLPRQTPWTAAPASGVEPSPSAADEAPLSRPEAVASNPGPGAAPAVTALTPEGPHRLDRWSLSSWSLVRQASPATSAVPAATSPALAIGGQLGASQAGSRLTYRFTPRLSANLRFSAPIPAPRTRNRGVNGEAALGVAWQPLVNLPLRLLAERRQRIGDLTGGRSAFALLAEGGIYGKALPLGFRLDGYGQSGIVSLRQRDWFVDGGLVAERPLFGRYSAGLGVWGGAQKGLNRLDLGPRISARMTRNVRLSLDYRYRALGNATPGSGFAVALGSDF